MQQSYSAIEGQTIFDVCLQVGYSIDMLIRLMQDSDIDNVNVKPKSQDQFIYDDTLIFNQGITNQFLLSGIIYCTDAGDNGNSYYIIKQAAPPPLVKGPVKLPPPVKISTMYQKTSATSFTSGADGTTSFSPLDKDGNSMAGNKYDITQIEIEIKPLTSAQFVWNTSLGTVSLLGGEVLDAGQTAFIIYSQMITP